LGLGAGVAFAALAQSPPAHIERWRQGAEGERATARTLRPLTKSGWVLINDVQRDRGVGLRPGWLQAVVVIWADFDQRSVQDNRTLWIHGKQLATPVRALPPRLDGDEIHAIATHLREVAYRGEAGW
jgi:hypothetical protein